MPNHNSQKNPTRIEHDLLGEYTLPEDVYYGIQTARAVNNFYISDVKLSFFPILVMSLAQIKKGAALTNCALKLIDTKTTQYITQACDEIIAGKLHDQFVVDMIQGGAGTSTNMNANEVIANRALEIAEDAKGNYKKIHPNNHVNLGQSTNDAYPSAINLTILQSLPILKTSLKDLIYAFRKKSAEFSEIIKMGRTQLQDAIPMTLGQEFEAFAVILENEYKYLSQIEKLFLELNMGATAIGTGLNAHPQFAETVIEKLQEITHFPLKNAKNLIAATQDTGRFVKLSGALKSLAIKLSKIASDLRLLSSGPRCGFYDISLPAVQPGSSIMPGKVNPVIPELINQVAFQVIGSDATITMAAEHGQLQLNVFEPIILFNLLQNLMMLGRAITTLQFSCIENIKANKEVCQNHIERSIGLVTALNPIIGYENATMIAKEALETGESVYNLVLRHKLLTPQKLKDALKPENMVSNKPNDKT